MGSLRIVECGINASLSHNRQQTRRHGSGTQAGRGVPRRAPLLIEAGATRPQHKAMPADGFGPQPIDLPPHSRTAEALRAFSAGNGYLTGQIIDRTI